MRRLAESFIEVINDRLIPQIPGVVALGNAELGQFDSLRQDDVEDEVDRLVNGTVSAWEQQVPPADVKRTAAQAGSRLNDVNERNLQRQMEKATGQRTIPTPQGIGARITAFASRNAELIGNAVRDHVGRLKQAIVGGITSSRPAAFIRRQVQRAGGIFRRRVVNIARDQAEKIGSQFQRTRLQVIGVKKFVWVTQGDDLVRDLHEEIEGQEFSMAKGHPTEGFPGDPINCRCVMGAVLPKKGLAPETQKKLATNRERRLAKARVEAAAEQKQERAARSRAGKKAARTRSKTEKTRAELEQAKVQRKAAEKKVSEQQASATKTRKNLVEERRKRAAESAARTAELKRKTEELRAETARTKAARKELSGSKGKAAAEKKRRETETARASKSTEELKAATAKLKAETERVKAAQMALTKSTKEAATERKRREVESKRAAKNSQELRLSKAKLEEEIARTKAATKLAQEKAAEIDDLKRQIKNAKARLKRSLPD